MRIDPASRRAVIGEMGRNVVGIEVRTLPAA